MASAFAKFHDVDTTLPKLIYLVINLLGLLAGMYKCASLGLLPTAPADWLQADYIRPVSSPGLQLVSLLAGLFVVQLTVWDDRGWSSVAAVFRCDINNLYILYN